MNKPYYQNFYKLQMAMMEKENDNVLIFGPAASGKCDALERCIEEYGKEKNVVLLTRKTALLMVAYKYPNVTCINWDTSIKNIKPEWFKENYDIIIIDGYCENWQQLVNTFPDKRIIMAVKKETLSYIEICNNVKAGKFEPIYVLMGEESYYIDKISEYIAHPYLPHRQQSN